MDKYSITHMKNYAEKVKLMRDSQIGYFRSKNTRHLKNAKIWEKEVDEMTKKILDDQTEINF